MDYIKLVEVGVMALPSNDTVISVVVLIAVCQYSRTTLMPVPSLRFQSDMTNYVMPMCHVIRLCEGIPPVMPPSSADIQFRYFRFHIHSELNVVSTHIPESENESNNTWKGTVKEICIILLYYVCAITDGKLGCSSGGKSTSITLGYSVHCYAISLAGGQLQFRSSTPSVNNWIAPPSTPHHFNPHFGIINWFKFEYYVVNVAFSEVQPYLIQCNIWIEIYIYINDDEASGLWYVAEYDSELATPSIPHDFNPNRIIILTIMLLCFYRLQSCASDSHFWFQTEGVIIEAFNSCRFAQHGMDYIKLVEVGVMALPSCLSVQSNYADARAIIAVPK
ncbi:hypothetical protein T08_6922, partial [Trichinella sp. T8]